MNKLWVRLIILVIVAATVVILWRQFRPAEPIPVGVVAWLASGAVIGSSEMNAGDLFREEHPQSRIRVLPVDDQWQPEKTTPAIQEAMDKGVRFFVSTHPSRCAVASMGLFADSRALMINSASATPALTGKDDFILRIIVDTAQEQRAIALYVDQMPGARILVLQDESNLPYTDPAFKSFSAELSATGKWQIVHRKLMVSTFKPDELRSLMAEQYDALYILAGTFQTAIGNIAQLFHYLHPEAPILLTPWARSPAILETAGPAIDRIILPSQYPSRHDDPVIDDYFRKFRARFGYEPHAMTVGIRQALELYDEAFAKGYDTPEKVRQYLLATPTHQTSLGPITFDRTGDVTRKFYFIQDLKKELK
jgi:branched-chain amino acid transport system substrate-binding protein